MGILPIPDRYVAPAAIALFAALFAAAAFVAKGGLILGPTVTIEVIVLVVAIVVIAAALVAHQGRPLYGMVTLVAGGVLAVFAGLSVAWSLVPDATWIDFGQSMAYMGMFATGIAAAHLWFDRWTIPLHAVLLALAVVIVAGLATKVVPGILSPNETFGRMRSPFSYWNAVALTAAMAMPLSLWLGTRPDGRPWVNALAHPLIYLSTASLFLAVSRGGLVVAAAMLALWFAVVPLRLRSLSVLGPAAIIGAVTVLWALDQPGLTEDNIGLGARRTAGAALGLFLIFGCAALYGYGVWLERQIDMRILPRVTQRRLGAAALGTVAVVAVVAFGALAFKKEGLTGNVSHAWSSLTEVQESTPDNDPGRLATASSVRPRYWREALAIWSDNRALGAGAGTFAVVRQRYAGTRFLARHAHGHVVQIMSDLGIVGLVLSLAALAAWLAAAGRAVGVGRRSLRHPWTPERIGVAALAIVVVGFGLHVAIDWTWYVPGVALPVLFAAGWVAGRGPVLGDPPVRIVPAPVDPRNPLRFLGGTRRAGAIFVVASLLALAALACYQPLGSRTLSERSMELSSEGQISEAVAKAKRAQTLDPFAVEPLFAESVAYQRAGNIGLALGPLEQAVKLQPANPETWHRLGLFELETRDNPSQSLNLLARAHFLSPHDPAVTNSYLRARQILRQRTEPQPAPQPTPNPAPKADVPAGTPGKQAAPAQNEKAAPTPQPAVPSTGGQGADSRAVALAPTGRG